MSWPIAALARLGESRPRRPDPPGGSEERSAIERHYWWNPAGWTSRIRSSFRRPRQPTGFFYGAIGLALLSFVFSLWLGRSIGGQPDGPASADPISVGFTYSPRQADYLDLPRRETYQAAIGLAPSLVRLGAYWDEIEPAPGRYEFAQLDWLIEEAARHERRVILTVGMKAPRWPEYFLPAWLTDRVDLPRGATVSNDPLVRARAAAFVRRVVARYRDQPAIAYWQVENEPLDPAGADQWRIGIDFLREEVAIVRAIDIIHRPVIVSMFVTIDPLSLLPWRRSEPRNRALALLETADILGLDVYPSLGQRRFGRDLYFNWSFAPWEEIAIDLRNLARSRGQEAWILEAQAEPWEPERVVYTDRDPSRSVQPALAAGIFERLRAAGFDNILFWGVEHWYMRIQRHDDATWWSRLGSFFPGPATNAAAVPPDETKEPA